MTSTFSIIKNPSIRYKLRRMKGFVLRCIRKKAVSNVKMTKFRVNNHETFFGYYDITPMSQCGTKLLAHAVAGKARGWRSGMMAKIGYFDLSNQNQFVEITQTSSWCWQMGARLQWLPNTNNKVLLFNCVNNRQHVAQLWDIQSKQQIDEWPMPIYDLAQCGTFAVSLDFHRLGILRAGYGYLDLGAGEVQHKMPEHDGLWHLNTSTKKTMLLANYPAIVNIAPREEFKDAIHYLNHVSISPNSKGIMFFHLWLVENESGKMYNGRLMYIDNSGTNLKLIADDMRPSHYCWLDDEEFLVTMLGAPGQPDEYRLYSSGQNKGILSTILPSRDGHPTKHPKHNWLLTDSYPDKYFEQNLEVYDLDKKIQTLHEKFTTGHRYQGEYRCDLHPRWLPVENQICIDSTHNNDRAMYVLNL
jgi:hypothetical protein